MAGKRVRHVVKPERCSHFKLIRFSGSARNGGYYRCADCGSVMSGRQIDISRSDKKQAEWVGSLSQVTMFDGGE